LPLIVMIALKIADCGLRTADWRKFSNLAWSSYNPQSKSYRERKRACLHP